MGKAWERGESEGRGGGVRWWLCLPSPWKIDYLFDNESEAAGRWMRADRGEKGGGRLRRGETWKNNKGRGEGEV